MARCGCQLQTLYFLQGNTLATFSFEQSRCYGIVSSPSLSLGASIAPMLQEQLQLFLSMQNKVFSSFIEQISSCIVGAHSTPHS